MPDLSDEEIRALAQDPDAALREPPAATEFHQRGDGLYELTAPGQSVRITLSNLTRSRDGLRAEVAAYCSSPTARTLRSRPGLLTREHLNLLAGSSRASLAKRLGEAAPDIDWNGLLTEAALATIDSERQGEPPVRVVEMPDRLDPGFRLAPVMADRLPATCFGEKATGKSHLAVSVAVSVASGAVVVPGFVPRQGPVLYLDWEEDDWIFKRRAEKIARGANLPGLPRDLWYRRMAGRLSEQTDIVVRQVADEGVALLVIDSVGLALGGAGEGDPADASIRFFDALRYTGAASWLNDQIAAENDGKARVRKAYGSTMKGYLSRGNYYLRCLATEGDTKTLVLQQEKPTPGAGLLPPLGLRLSFLPDRVVWEEAAAPADDEDDKGPSTSERLLVLLRGGLRASAAALAAEVGTTEDSVRVTLGRLRRRGEPLVLLPGEHGGPGLWSLAEEEEAE